MRAAYYEAKGPAFQVLQVGEVPDPVPGPGEVRVRVRVSAVNPSDTKARGAWNGDATMRWPRIIPHQDGAGVVDRVGEGVSPARLGERVWVYEAQWNRPAGTAAELVVVPEERAVPLPDGVPFEVGAALGIPALTAHRCLLMDGPIRGETVLVQGGGGAVGEAAVRLATWAGARVIATVSRPEQADVARAAGAVLVVDRKREDVVARVLAFTRREGVARVVEVSLEENLEADVAVLRAGGAVAAYASGPPDSAPRVPFRACLGKGLSLHFVLVYVMSPEAHRAAIRDVTAALADGYAARVGCRFALDDVAAAHRAQEGGQVVGKIVIDVAGDGAG